jgi:ATP-dependent Lon protease
MVLHLDVGREKSIKALEKAMVNDNEILLSCQEKVQKEEPEAGDIFRVGTVARVRQMLKLPNGTIRVLVEGLYRARIMRFVQTEPYFEVAYEELPEEYEVDAEIEALMRAVLEHFEHYSKLSKKITPETFASVMDVEEPGRLADVITSHLTLKIRDKQAILETVSVKERLMRLLDLLNNESEVLE